MCIDMMHNYWLNTYTGFFDFYRSLLTPLGQERMTTLYNSMIYDTSNRVDEHNVEYIVPFLHRDLPQNNTCITGKNRQKAFHRIAASHVFEVIIDIMLNEHVEWLQRLDLIKENEGYVEQHNKKCLFCHVHARDRWPEIPAKHGADVPSEILRSVLVRNALKQLFSALHELGLLCSSTSQHIDDGPDIEKLINAIMRLLAHDLVDLVKKFNDPTTTPSSHVFFAHALKCFLRFGPLKDREVSSFETEQGRDVRAVSRLTNRGSKSSDPTQLCEPNLLDALCIAGAVEDR